VTCALAAGPALANGGARGLALAGLLQVVPCALAFALGRRARDRAWGAAVGVALGAAALWLSALTRDGGTPPYVWRVVLFLGMPGLFGLGAGFAGEAGRPLLTTQGTVRASAALLLTWLLAGATYAPPPRPWRRPLVMTDARPALPELARPLPVYGFEVLNTLPRPKETRNTWPYASLRYISPDGRTVAGEMSFDIGRPDHGHNVGHAFVWTEARGLEDLGTRIAHRGVSSVEWASEDGRTVLGRWSDTGNSYHFLRAAGRKKIFRDLCSQVPGASGSGFPEFEAVSPDGRWLFFVQNGRLARWTPDRGTEHLTAESAVDTVRAVAPGGGACVGMAYNKAAVIHAFLWTEEGGVRDLGTLPGCPASVAFGLNEDASRVAGVSGGRLFLWEAESGMSDLGPLPGYSSHSADPTGNGVVIEHGPFTLSEDGRVIAGKAGNSWFVYLPGFGSVPVNEVLRAAGAGEEILRWGGNLDAAAVSRDGRTLTGVIHNGVGDLLRWCVRLR